MANSDKNNVKVSFQGDISDVQKKIGEALNLVDKMGSSINTKSATAVRAYRAEADAAAQLLKQLNASDGQHAALARSVQRVEKEVSLFQSRMAGGARQLASGLDQMARSGQTAGEGLKSVISSGAEMAFVFGAGGPIVGAIGIAGLAIFSLFDRARKEMEATRKKAEAEIAQLRKAGVGAQVERQQELYSGAGGIQSTESRIGTIREELKGTAVTPGMDTREVERRNERNFALTAELLELEKKLVVMKREHAEVAKMVEKSVAKTVELEATGARLAEEERRKREAEAFAREKGEWKNRPMDGEPFDMRAQERHEAATRENAARETKPLDALRRSGMPDMAQINKDAGVWRPEDSAGIERAKLEIESLGKAIEDVKDAGLGGLKKGAADAFEAMTTGAGGAGAALKGALFGAIGDAARAKGKYYLTYGLASIASQFATPPNPHGIASGTKLLAQSAGMFALAGTMGKAGGSGSSSVGGGGGGRDASRSDTQQVESNGPRGNIKVVFPAMTGTSDPRFRQAFKELLREVGANRDVEFIAG